jgi:hypothetical protein
MVAVGGGVQAFLAHDADGGAIDALEEMSSSTRSPSGPCSSPA